MIRSGVYMIKGKDDGRFYIGSSVNVFYRWKRHLRQLRSNKHNNKKLQNYFNKYGAEGLVFSFIHPVIGDIETLRDFERYYLIKYRPHDTGFNIMLDSVSWKGFKHSKESLEKCKAASLKAAEMARKPVYGLDMKTGDVVHSFNSVTAANDVFPGVYQSLAKKSIHAGGFIWIYQKDHASFDLEARLRHKNRQLLGPHSVLDLETGIYYKTIKDLAFSLNEHHTHFCTRFKRGYLNDRFLRV